MPMNYEAAQTPSGKTFLKIHSSGDVTAADAEAMNKDIAPGQKLYNLPIFATVAPHTSFSPEARKAFTQTGGGAQQPVAIVVGSAPLRVMMSFIIRISGAAEQTKFFTDEAEAKKWFEAKVG